MQIYFISRRLFSDTWRMDVLFSTASSINHESYKFKKEIAHKARHRSLYHTIVFRQSCQNNSSESDQPAYYCACKKKIMINEFFWILQLKAITAFFIQSRKNSQTKEAGSLFTWFNFIQGGRGKKQRVRGMTHISECCVCPLCKDLVLFQ